MKIEIELLTDSARLPVYSTDEAAGADLCSDEAVMHQSCERREHFDLPVGAHYRNVSANTRGGYGDQEVPYDECEESHSSRMNHTR